MSVFLQIWVYSAIAVTPFFFMSMYNESGKLTLGQCLEWFIMVLACSHIGWLFYFIIDTENDKYFIKSLLFYFLILGYLIVSFIIDNFICNVDIIRESSIYNKRIL